MSETILDEAEVRLPDQSFKLRAPLIWGSILMVGVLFKIVHWPFASLLTVLPPAGLLAYSTYGMMRKQTRTILCVILFSLSLLYALYLVYGTQFRGGYPVNLNGLAIFFAVAVVWYAGYEIARVVRRNRIISKEEEKDEDPF